MLVICSDIHLTDGSSGKTISERAFRILRSRLSDMAYDASWRSDDRYVPLEGLDLVLLGDVLDVIRSSSWLTGEMRPWHEWDSAEFVKQIRAVNRGILTNNTGSLGVLKEMGTRGVPIPPATAEGRPAGREAERHMVPVRIHFVVGNHDWFYHLPGKSYGTIRKSVVDAMGLCNSPSRRSSGGTTPRSAMRSWSSS